MKTLLLNRDDVQCLLSPEEVIAAVKSSYIAYSGGQTIQPSIVSIEIPQYCGEMDVKASYSRNTEVISVKCASGFYENKKNGGLPNSMSTLLLFDGTTGFPLCILDASLITGWRTGAAGAISASLLARADSRTAAIIGTGDQARMQLRALKTVIDLHEIRLWGRSSEQMHAYWGEMAKEMGCDIHLCPSPEEAVREADIIVTTTPSSAPLIRQDWVSPGTHIIAVGADMEGKQELDPMLFQGAKIVVDSLSQCRVRGEIQNPLHLGIISEERIHGEIGQILAGEKAGREKDSEITIFDLTGMAVQDNFTAAKIYQRALALKRGTYYDFIK